MPYQIETFPNGFSTLKNLDMNECFHSAIGPWQEAQEVYLLPSGLAERLSRSSELNSNLELDPLVLYDVGMGLATHAIAAIQCAENSPGSRDLTIVSFEIDLEPLCMALENSDAFPFLKPYQEQVQHLIRHARVEWHSKNGRSLLWELKKGDFLHGVSGSPAPEVIYFDFFSPKKCPELWGYRVFKDLFECCQPRLKQNQSTLLLTYSASTWIRSSLLLAGFQVGRGAPTSQKKETTLALTRPDPQWKLERPLTLDWLQKFDLSRKSQGRYPIPVDHPFPTDDLAFKAIETALSTVQD